MDYRKVYMRIIFKAKSENRRKGQGTYYEAHHILPKSLFPLWAKRKSNIVLLTAREHFFCHQLLFKIYSVPQMSYALWWLAHDGKHILKTSREYAKIKENYKMSQKHIDSCATANKQRAENWSETDHLKMSAAQQGKKWFTNGQQDVRSQFCPKGFKPGRANANSKGSSKGRNLGKKWYSDGKIEVFSVESPGSGFIKARLDNYQEKLQQLQKEPYSREGRHWYTDGINQKFVRDEEAPDGWYRGLCERRTNALKGKGGGALAKGKKWFTNGSTNLFAYECPDGFFHGKRLSTGEVLKYED